MKFLIPLLSLVLLASCATPVTKVKVDEDVKGAVPLTYVLHSLRVPVKINGNTDANFILDTGIGINLISKRMCEQLQCKTKGSYSGKRMSGQKITIPLTQLSSLAMGPEEQKDVTVGVFDMTKLTHEYADISGFLSLNFFENHPFTIDYKNNVVILETAKSLAKRRKAGRVLPVMLDREGIALSIFMMMNIPNGKPARLEVDTGSDALILNENYMTQLGFQTADAKLKKVTGEDETKYKYVRYFGEIEGDISPVKGDKFKQKNPKVIFQKIIYDGLVGHDYFKNFIVTYNITSAEIIIAPKDVK